MNDEEISIRIGDIVQTDIQAERIPWQSGIIPFGLPGKTACPIFLRAGVMQDICRHGKANADREIMGILVGYVRTIPGEEGKFIRVEAVIPSTLALGCSNSIEFDHDAWTEVLNLKANLYPDMKIVGWYHTHPHLGVFFSHADEFSHRLAFPNNWQIGLTYDPVGNSAAFFGWDNSGCITLLDGFYEMLAPNYTFSKVASLGISWDFKNIKVRSQVHKTGTRTTDGNNSLSYSPVMRKRNSPASLRERQGATIYPSKNIQPNFGTGRTPLATYHWALIIILVILLTAIGILSYSLITGLPPFTFQL